MNEFAISQAAFCNFSCPDTTILNTVHRKDASSNYISFVLVLLPFMFHLVSSVASLYNCLRQNEIETLLSFHIGVGMQFFRASSDAFFRFDPT